MGTDGQTWGSWEARFCTVQIRVYKQDRQCTHKVTSTRILATIASVEKAISITYSECGCVALSTQLSKRMRLIITCVLSGSTIFLHLISHTARFSRDGQTDMTMVIVAFRKFENAPKNKTEEESHKCHGTVTVSSEFSPLSRTVSATTTIG